MKLIYCPECGDARALQFTITHCECGHSWGLYNKDGVKAVFGGKGFLFGIGNGLLLEALHSNVPTFQGWFYHSTWFTERMRENVYYCKEEEDFSYSIFEEPDGQDV